MTALTSLDQTQAHAVDAGPSALSRSQKAAMIVQILSKFNTRISLGGLGASLQLRLADLVQLNGVMQRDTIR